MNVNQVEHSMVRPYLRFDHFLDEIRDIVMKGSIYIISRLVHSVDLRFLISQ